MTIGIIGQKRGMTRIFTPDGASIPVTVVEATPNRVTQIKSKEKERYRAIQVTTGHRRAIRINKPETGHLTKAGVETGCGFWEFSLDDNEGEDFQLGKDIKVDIFTIGQKVDVTGISKGKGFSGVVKRHNFRTQDASHGNSLSHRAPGSIGQNQTPGRVFKGKKMAGQLGNARCTVQNLEVIRVDSERDLLIIKGAIPGAPGGYVIIRPAIKAHLNQATE